MICLRMIRSDFIIRSKENEKEFIEKVLEGKGMVTLKANNNLA